MRIALLSALADPAGSGGGRLAFRRFAGKSVLSHQMDCAALLGCTRVICLTGPSGPDFAAARGYAERHDLRFDTADSVLRLIAMVSADDDVVLIDDGVLPDRAVLIPALEGPGRVLAFPADPALELGFERLDATRAWGGALRTRGDCVARLADLPPDCDLGSSLLRVALQSGARVVELDPAPLAEHSWMKRVDTQVSSESEWHWIARQVQPAPFHAPGVAVAERIGLRWARDAVGGRWARAPHLAAVIAGATALLSALAGAPLVGLGLLLAAFAALAIAGIFDRVEALGARPAGRGVLITVASWIGDGLLLLLLSKLVVTVPGWLELALPVALILALRMGAAQPGLAWRRLFGDRVLLLAGLLPAAWFGWSTVAVAIVTIAALAVQLWATRKALSQLTAD